MPPVVRFDNVSKLYQIGSGHGSLREALASLSTWMLGRGTREPSDANLLWALKDVSFDLEPGQVLGVVGRNGAGKTTLLKLLSRVVQPTSGRIDARGRVSALIELGAGFHPDLTGRENVYLNGAILGLSRKEIDRKFDSIVAFAELAKFIDTPVKRYSSGMYARLGFAVAAHSDPDMLLVDEVLAVGDLSFQQKCYDFIHSFVTAGRATIFVSHSMYVLEQLCTELLWLDEGRVMMVGKPGDVLSAYLEFMDERAISNRVTVDDRSGHLAVGTVRFSDVVGRERDVFASGQDIVVTIPYHASVPVPRPHFSLGVCLGNEPPLFLASMLVDGHAPEIVDGDGELKCIFRSVPLLPRVYTLYCEVWGADRARVLVNWHKVGAFRIRDDMSHGSDEATKGLIRHSRTDAPIRVPYDWAQSQPKQPACLLRK